MRNIRTVVIETNENYKKILTTCKITVVKYTSIPIEDFKINSFATFYVSK